MYLSIFQLPEPWHMAGFPGGEPSGGRAWRNSEIACAYSDSERHLGHVIKMGQWQAYDATHVDEASGYFKDLGSFPDLGEAIQAVEDSVARPRGSFVMRASGSGDI